MSTPIRRSIAQPSPRVPSAGSSNLRQTSTSEARPVSRSTADEEPHLEQARRTQAARILQSYEQLVWFSMQRNEVLSHNPHTTTWQKSAHLTRSVTQSLVQTRLYFEAILAGVLTPDTRPDWPTDYSSEEPKSAKDGAAGRNSPAGKHKSRVASGEGSEKRRRDREKEKGRRSGAGLE